MCIMVYVKMEISFFLPSTFSGSYAPVIVQKEVYSFVWQVYQRQVI